ncbi:MAG: hypothetical protein ACW977_07970 [Candidatus Thorarchaeota archaeon]|jgi:hypothetical protein
MGLKTKKGKGNAKYLNVMFGKVVQKVKADTEGAISRVNKNGDTVYENHYDSFSGSLVSARIESTEKYGDFVELVMESDGDYFNVQFPVRSGYGRSFMYRLPNLEVTEEFEITPYDFENNEGKRVSGLNLYQNGEKILSFWTRENPGKLPELEEVEFQGKTRWDDGKRTKYLVKAFNKKMSGMAPPEPKPEPKPKPKAKVAEVEEDDDLPF